MIDVATRKFPAVPLEAKNYFVKAEVRQENDPEPQPSVHFLHPICSRHSFAQFRASIVDILTLPLTILALYTTRDYRRC